MNKYRGRVIAVCSILLLIGVVFAGTRKNATEDTTIQVSGQESTEIPEAQEIVEEQESTEISSEESVSVEEQAAEQEQVPEVAEAAYVEEAAEPDYVIADVDRYVNVRNQPSTEGEIVGRIYGGAIAEVLAVAGEQGDWFQITSGNVEGYIKSEFFLHGEEVTAMLDQCQTEYAQVQVERLNVRAGQDTSEKKIGYLVNGEKVKVLENCGEWLRVQYTKEKEGFVATQYVVTQNEYAYAKTLEEAQADGAAEKDREKRLSDATTKKAKKIKNIEFPATSYTSNEELRKEIVNYALQYVGGKYVSGGSSLATGTDCSGFTCFIYADFGYSISRTPQGQFTNAGRSIADSEMQAGDIICYSTNGGKSCTHVALYIGDGKIVHAANSRKGVIVGMANYAPIIGIRNVID